MADIGVEIAFVGCVWRDLVAGKEASVEPILVAVGSEMLEDVACRTVYADLSDRFALGEALDPVIVGPKLLEGGVPASLLEHVEDAASQRSPILKTYAAQVLRSYQKRRAAALCEQAIHWFKDGTREDGGRKAAEELAGRLIDLYATEQASRPQNLKDMLAAEVEAMTGERQTSVVVPYPKLQKACGPWVAGEVVGLSAYSGCGKSTLAVNLTRLFVRRGVPVIVVPTEMRQQWLSRLLAAEAGVRQDIAEKKEWLNATADEQRRYAEAMDWLKDAPLEVLNRGSIKPQQIIAAVRIIRKRWPGRVVVVVVDHMHRLDYGSEPSNEQVGMATKRIKDFVADDADGLVGLLLYQPRKPEQDAHRPVTIWQVRGDSTVANEVDVHMSPYRQWVKVNEVGRTATTPTGSPQFSKAEADGAKLDDEHMYIKVDKRRVGGEGPTLWLDIDAPTGRIDEVDYYASQGVA